MRYIIPHYTTLHYTTLHYTILYYTTLTYTNPNNCTGEFIPNNLGSRPSDNEILDILRCKMEDAQTAYSTLAGTDKHIYVEIFREKTSLIQFSVPWNSRVQSSFLAHPHDTFTTHSSSEIKVLLSSSKNPRASVFDPWMGFNKSTPGVWKREKLFMCVPGMDVPPSRRVIHVSL